MNKQGLGLVLGLLIMFTPAYAEVSPESIIQIYQRLDYLEKEARSLRGENEVLKHQLEQIKKVQKQGFLNVDERMDELANSLKSKPKTDVDSSKEKKPESTETPAQTEKPEEKKEVATVVTAKVDTPTETDTPVTTAETKQEEKPDKGKTKSREPTAYEKETYQVAFNQMNSSPTGATKAFQDYIKLQPNSPLAANAQYWIGEIKYSHNNYKGAVQEFIKVLQNYKYSSKAPDAAIKLGYSFYALKNWTYARRTFEDVLKYFPENKNAVNLAKQRLAKMKAAGN